MYLFYIDESGNTKIPEANCLVDEMIYVVLAVGMFAPKWRSFHSDILRLKKGLFEEAGGNFSHLDVAELEIKSTWLRREKERREKPFLGALSEEMIARLTRAYYAQLRQCKMRLISVVIDKQKWDRARGDAAELRRKAWEMLCERIQNYMGESQHKHRALLIADNINAQANHQIAVRHGEFLQKQTSANLQLRNIIEMPLFTDSKVSEGIQLADLCAYNVYRQFARQEEYPYFRKILPFFYRSARTEHKKIDGLKVFPDHSPLVQWAQSF